MKLRAAGESWSFGNGVNFFQQIRRDNYRLGDRVEVARVEIDFFAVGDKEVESRLMGPALPLFSLDRQEAQVLIDDLWQAGLRPSESGEGNSRLIVAKDAHITDLRAIVYKQLGIDT